MPIEQILLLVWSWVVRHGILLAALVLIGLLIPRIARRIIASFTHSMDESTEAAKGRKAIVGAMTYIAEAVAYFILITTGMQNLGVNLAAAAIPATVVSAAIGFGAQKIIGDLLGGFFIITEKQYGVGDWVRFYSSAATVEGDVVDMTLRATTIRTLNGEEITVPNGEARMCVNASARWARAVIAIPVPITAGSSMADINRRTLNAALEAVEDPSIRDNIRSDITVQAATAVTPPTAMGLPWTATMRLLIDVAPGKQWAVERAVRAAVLDEWWEDYGKRASETALLDDDLTKSLKHLADTEEFSPIGPIENNPTQELPAETDEALAQAAEINDVPREQVLQEIVEKGNAEEQPEKEKFGLLSFGGRVRPSSTLLGLSLAVLGVIGTMTLSGGEHGDPGWLAPQRFDPPAPVTTSVPVAPSYEPPAVQTPIEEAPTSEAPVTSQQPNTQTSVAPTQQSNTETPIAPSAPSQPATVEPSLQDAPGAQRAPATPNP